MTRSEALSAAAGIIARHTPDILGLALLLDAAGQTRLAAALRARLGAGERLAVIVGEPRPDPVLWAAQAGRVVGRGRR